MRVVMRDDIIRERQNLIIVGLLAIIVILVVAWLLYNSLSARNQVATNPNAPGVGTAPGTTPAPGTPTPGGFGAGPQQSVTPPSSPPPSAPQASKPSATPAPASKASSQPAPPKTTTVLGSVGVTYPANWSMTSGSGGSILLTDGKATMEIAQADSSATDAKSAAAAALADRAGNAEITAEGARRVAGHDAYVYMVNTSSGPMRIVGIDASKRVVLIESANTGELVPQKAAFERIESGLRFK